MTLILSEDQEGNLAIAPKTRSGNPARIDGVPVWEVTNGLLGVASSVDGLSAVVTPTDTGLGFCQVKVTADADLGSGVRPLIGVLDVEVVAGEAVTLGIDAISVTPRPTPPSP